MSINVQEVKGWQGWNEKTGSREPHGTEGHQKMNIPKNIVEPVLKYRVRQSPVKKQIPSENNKYESKNNIITIEEISSHLMNDERPLIISTA